MFLIQILLPLTDNKGKPFPRKLFHDVKDELATRFQGLTIYSRAPAEGIWKPAKGTRRDDIVVYEIMAPTFRRAWWRRYRARLEKLFRQQSLVIRAHQISVL